ncbi:MAG: SLAP domain-containing protein [Clostridium sp.]
MVSNSGNTEVNDTIVINGMSKNDVEDTVYTLGSNLSTECLVDSLTYKVTLEGQVISTTKNNSFKLEEDNSIETPIEEIAKELTERDFQDIPYDLSYEHIEKIKMFSRDKHLKLMECAQMFPCIVERNGENSFKIILLMYNCTTDLMVITKFPIKLLDKHNKVVFVGLVDIDKNINPMKIGICSVEINDDNMELGKFNLDSWTINFEL